MVTRARAERAHTAPPQRPIPPIAADDGDLAAVARHQQKSIDATGAPATAPQDLFAMLARRSLGRSKIDEVGRNGRLVPLQTETGEIWNVNPPSLDLVGLGKDWIGPILPF